MPAYDFRCTVCEERFEVVRAMGSTADECCPSCGGAAKRVFTPVGVSFKGSGFHNTDYRSRPTADSAASEAACPAKKEGSAACSTCPAAE
jgi:putative FmdB family regulatory protein